MWRDFVTDDGRKREGRDIKQLFPPADEIHHQRQQPLDPYKLLFIAILEDAIHQLVRGDKTYWPYKDAVEWFKSDNNEWIFSFISVCDVLGLSASYVRRKVYAISDAKGKQKEQKIDELRREFEEVSAA